jgi:hypothetical protein
MACQMPLHRSPVMIPLHRPAPELPTSRPLPLALDAPTVIVTATLPPGPMPPVTLPPPADETRRPMTVKGTLLVELQLPAVVTKATLQTPSKAPALTILARLAASAVPGAATAAKTAAVNIHRKARTRLASAKKAINRVDIVIFSCFLTAPRRARVGMSSNPVPGFIVANLVGLCHKRNLHRPADQGLPWRCPCRLFLLGNNRAISTL